MRGGRYLLVGAVLALLAGIAPCAAVPTKDFVPQLRSIASGSAEYIYVGGYNNVGDSGGGWFVTQGGGTGCAAPVSYTGVAKWGLTSAVITFPTGTTLPSVGMGVVSSTPSGIPQYDMVVSQTTGTPPTITLAVAPTSSTTSGTISFSADNGGNTIWGGSGFDCFTRTSSDYTPQEWGAYEDYSTLHHDDTLALGNWMNAPQPHYALPGGSLITQTLWCNDGAIIQGSPTAGVANTNQVLPTFDIYANKATYGFTGPAMLVMTAGSRCAIHSLGLIGDDSGYFDTVDADGAADLIDQHSYLSGGCHNLATMPGNADLEIFDSSLVNSVGDNVVVVSPNSKVVRNVIAGAGAAALAGGCTNSTSSLGNNITFSSTSDIVIADNTIEQAQGWGIDIETGRLLRVTGNHFDSNGLSLTSTSNATGGVKISSSGSVTLCGNSFNASGSGAEGVPTLTASHIYFIGQDDSISLCGNVYLPAVASGNPQGLVAPSVSVTPDFDYDSTANAILTNVSIADNPAPQAASSSAFSTNAANLLTSSNVGQVPLNYFSGLTLYNASTNAINITGGSATDSTGSAAITLPSTGCTVDIGAPSNGLGYLDVGSIASNTTYFYFVVSGAHGANPSCMASINPTPSFQHALAYTISVTGYTNSTSYIVYNVGGPNTLGTPATQLGANPLANISVNDYVTCSCLASATTIASLTPYNLQATVDINTGGTCITSIPTTAKLEPGMLASGPGIPANDYLTAVGACLGANSATLSAAAVPNPSVLVTFAGNYTMTLNALPSTVSPPTPATFTVYHGLYRLVGELYTTGMTPAVVRFTQDNDTFYLTTPVQDINTTGSLCSVSTGVTNCALSIPCGRSVASSTCAGTGAPELEAFGRVVGGDAGAGILLSSGDITPAAPTNFITGQPGYTTTTSGTTTSYPFRLYATINGTSGAYVKVIGSSPGTPDAYEVTDGWVFHRSQ